ncbi:MAG TPA: TolC family protein [Cyclobacteriaceae bacterium]
MKYDTRTILLAAALCIAWIGSHAQTWTLDSVLAAVERNNPELEAYNNRIRAFDAYAEGAKSWMAPMVGAGTFMKPYPGESAAHENEEGAWMFSIEQDIPNPAKLKANKRYMDSRSDAERQARSVQLNALRSEARTLYYQWLVAEKKLKTLAENEQIMELMLRLSRIRYPYNQASLSSIYRAEGRLEEVHNGIAVTKSDIESIRFRLQALMAIPTGDSIMIDTTTRVVFEPDPTIADTAALSDRRSDVRQLEESIRTMRLNEELRHIQAKPDFRIRFDHMQPIGDMPTSFSAMAMVSIPIAPWSSKMYKSEVRGMQYDVEAMKDEREAILIETRGKLTALAARIMATEQAVKNYESKIIPALRKHQQAVMLAYEENQEQLPTVVDAWEALNMAQMEYLEKMETYYLMISEYDKELEK